MATFPDLIHFEESNNGLEVVVGGFSFRAKNRRLAAKKLRRYLLRQVIALHAWDTDEDCVRQLENIRKQLAAKT